MLFKALIALFVISVAPVLPAQDRTPVGKITFDKPFHDGGKVFEGSKLVHLFNFKNNTSVTYKMDHLEKTCACANVWLIYGGKEIEFKDVAFNPQILPPGGEGKLKILLDMTGKHRLEDGTATLRFSDPTGKHSHHQVKFQATGMAYFKLSPPSLTISKIRWDEKRDFSFSLTSPHLEKWSLTDWSSKLPNGVTLEKPVITKGKKGPQYTFTGHIGPNLKPGTAGGAIKLTTDFKKLKHIEFTITADVTKPLVLSRNHLGFGLIQRRRGKTLSFTLTCIDEKFPLKKVKASLCKMNQLLKYTDLKLVEDKPGREFTISLTIKPGIPKGFCKGLIELQLDHPFIKQKRISFGGIVR